ncbi:hypothetical protein LEP1GSC008_1412 [Leptospira kirschneri serovar Bulgarica str. Nikolaevo]|uniref:Uncharacterized protein n=1 Tax=Leptospira kirschneri serovar Bulgarica str. Nikolaevo TaxID=1240687 RepID=M6FDI0_9LEPT|nr:hypothetical protein LEP1GSC008_1412 [Leptospira kirschneri serovar Bulgarica str. Nikolaevo]
MWELLLFKKFFVIHYADKRPKKFQSKHILNQSVKRIL